MKRLIFLLLSIVLIVSCGQQKMTSEQIDMEKKTIESLIAKINNGYESKDIESVTNMFSKSDELIVFGTDSAEVIKSIIEWKTQVKNDFQLIESVKFGDLRNLSIQISTSGDLAAAVYEVPVDMVFAGQSSHVLIRFANTWKKENGEWRIIQWLASIASKGQSSAEILEQMKKSGN
ncbi:MAG: nuclear transport factor 2 family protein [Promethearchaeota archaeon]